MPPLAAGSQLLIQFKAGKMIKEDKLVRPDERKGLLRVIKAEDGLVHLEWFVREPEALEPQDDVIVFPGEATFAQVGAASKRVMQLKFPDQADRNMLFWMQEADSSRDAQLIERTNNMLQEAMSMDVDDWQEPSSSGFTPSSALERGHAAGAAAAGLEVPGGPTVGLVPSGPGQGPTGQLDIASILRNIGAAGPSGPPAAAAAGPGGRGAADAGDSLMQALLSAMQRQQGQGGRDAAIAEELARRQAAAAGPSLDEVLRPDVLAPLLADEEVADQLAQFLPESQRGRGDLVALAHSPQFHQQLQTFSAALQTGQLDLGQFGLRAAGYSVADFLGAIQDLVDREQQQSQPQH